MITRYLSSAGIGIAVTTALLWTMNALIDMGETVSTPRPPINLPAWVRVIDDTEVETTIQPPDRLPEPSDVPELRPPTETTAAVIPVKVSKLPNAPSGPAFGAGLMGNPDSALINVMTAQPEYPMAALNKGLEGYVIVSFDVSELGTVENVEVVESSHSIFNKAAVKAAYRSKYRPKTVDGVSQRTQDLKKMIRFEIEN
jgi:protein TonB